MIEIGYRYLGLNGVCDKCVIQVCDINRIMLWARAQSGVCDSTGIKLWATGCSGLYQDCHF